MERKEEDEEEIVCLDQSFFINDDYELTTFTFGSQDIQLFCLNSASTDFDLTGQLVWPGAMLLNDYLSKNAKMLQGCSVIELGSGVGITGILCSRFCRDVVLTDHNDEVLKILKKNIELHASPENPNCCAGLVAEKLEWGNSDQINQILNKHSGGFDLVLGADIYDCDFNFSKLHNLPIQRISKSDDFIIAFQQSSIPLLFDTVKQLLQIRGKGQCKFILAYVSRFKIMDSLVISEGTRLGMQITEVAGTRCVVRNHDGVIFEVTLQEEHEKHSGTQFSQAM